MTKYITEHELSHSLLENIPIIPNDPIFVFVASISSFLALILVIMYQKYRQGTDSKEVRFNGFIIAELFFFLLTFVTLQFSYNGLILLVFLDIFYTYADFDFFKRKSYWFLLLLFSFGGLWITNEEVLALVIRLPSIDRYLSFLPLSLQFTTLLIRKLLTSMNMIIFIASLVMAIIISITENQEIEKKLEQVAKVNEELNRYVAITEKVVADKERKRISREVHDTLGHVLTGISAGIDATQVLLEKDSSIAQKQLSKISQAVREGLYDVRQSIEKLRPGALEDRTLKDALEKVITEFQELSQLTIVFNYRWGDVYFDTAKEHVIFRVMQESMTNSLRHGHAKMIQIDLLTDQNYLIILQDDGVGFEELHIGYGLMQIKERLAIIGGRVTFDGTNGFKTVIIIPKIKGEDL